MKAILEASSSGALKATVPVVLSNNADAPALDTAKKFGVQTAGISHRGLSREAHEDLLLKQLATYEVDYVVLAGYMRILTSHFLRNFRDPAGYFRVINIHPSILPAFPGANAYEEAFAYGVRLSGITVHLVDEQVDHGPIIAQESFERLDSDSLETFKSRGLAVEHRLYPAVLQRVALNGIHLLNRKPCEPIAAVNHPTGRSNPK